MTTSATTSAAPDAGRADSDEVSAPADSRSLWMIERVEPTQVLRVVQLIHEVTTTVTVDDLPDLAPGQAVTVTPDGAGGTEPADGEVSGVGTVGTSSGSATTYPVTVSLTDPPDGLRNGATATLSIVTARTGEAIAFPTSAIDVEGGRATVTVPGGRRPHRGDRADRRRRPHLDRDHGSAPGTDGLATGQTVVLADLDAPLPTSATDTEDTGPFTGGLGGFGGRGWRDSATGRRRAAGGG